MKFKAVQVLFGIALLGVLMISGCSSGSSAPQPGTPRFYWAAANETWAAGDYQKTAEHLSRLITNQNEYTARAEPWYLVITSGMARAYMDLGDYSEFGGKAKPALATTYRRHMSDFRTYASRASLQFAQAFQDFDKRNKDPKIPLAFTYPMGNPTMSSQVQLLGKGVLPRPEGLEEMRRQHVMTGIVQATCNAAGAPDDAAKTQSFFKAGAVEIPRETFMLAMAKALHDQSQMFTRMKLDNPDRLKMFNSFAQNVVKGLPKTKDTDALNNTIEKFLKTAAPK